MIWKLKFYVPSLNLLYTVDEMMTSCLLVQALTRNHHMETHLCTSHFVRDGITSVHTLDNSTLVYVLNIHIGQLICFLGLQFFQQVNGCGCVFSAICESFLQRKKRSYPAARVPECASE